MRCSERKSRFIITHKSDDRTAKIVNGFIWELDIGAARYGRMIQSNLVVPLRDTPTSSRNALPGDKAGE
jgi:hypothetical protein